LADPQFYTIVEQASGHAVGLASYLRIDPANGVIEVGHLNFSPLLQQTAAATEAMYLMMRHAFELGYRRYEWKCNALNVPSRRAAERLGFLFEGLFRQSMITKGRNRDTAWYSILDGEWPAVRLRLEQWLSVDNFDAAGRQQLSLSSMMASWRQQGI
ncbi:MAG: GNAT family N-acetyltransferase, partial [Aquitalea sp.]|nr:GNAT family N-acetyltransferase [Aquitalea sp.]